MGWITKINDLQLQANNAIPTEMRMDVSVLVDVNDFRKLVSFLCSISTVFPECRA